MSDTTVMQASREADAAKGPSTARPAASRAPRGGRRVKLMVSRVDPWSAMKVGFLLSVALGIDTMGVLTRTRSGAVVRVPESAAA